MNGSQHFVVTTAIDSRESAELLARSAVEAGLAAAAQVVGPVFSTYRWKGVTENAQEWQVSFKTVGDRYPDLERHIREQHSYELPGIMCLPIVAGFPAYLDWITEHTRPS